MGPITSVTLIDSMDIGSAFGGILTLLRRDGTQESFLLESRGLELLYATLREFVGEVDDPSILN